MPRRVRAPGGAVVLESVADIRREHGAILRAVEWTLTIAFTVEYALRLTAVQRPWRYATSFFGVVDLLSIVPTYLSLVVPETHSFMVIRAIRRAEARRADRHGVRGAARAVLREPGW